jgi:hypothetical protein
MRKTLSLKRLLLLAVMAWMLVATGVAFAQEATTVAPAEEEAHAEETVATEGEAAEAAPATR